MKASSCVFYAQRVFNKIYSNAVNSYYFVLSLIKV